MTLTICPWPQNFWEISLRMQLCQITLSFERTRSVFPYIDLIGAVGRLPICRRCEVSPQQRNNWKCSFRITICLLRDEVAAIAVRTNYCLLFQGESILTSRSPRRSRGLTLLDLCQPQQPFSVKSQGMRRESLSTSHSRFCRPAVTQAGQLLSQLSENPSRCDSRNDSQRSARFQRT